MPDIETLITEGFLFTETAVEMALLTADFGGGIEVGANIGHADGLRTWSLKIDVLPDSTDQGAPAIGANNETRAVYLWRFFVRSKLAGNAPFWIEVEDPQDGDRKLFLACFVDHKLSYSILCAKVYSSGLQLRQRRLPDLLSPLAVDD